MDKRNLNWDYTHKNKVPGQVYQVIRMWRRGVGIIYVAKPGTDHMRRQWLGRKKKPKKVSPSQARFNAKQRYRAAKKFYTL
jgi:hypothetical protein